MQSIGPIHNVKFKVNSRQQFAPTINKTKTDDLIETYKLSDGDIIYLYTKDSHNAIQDLQIKYNELNDNMKFIKAGTEELYDVSAELEKVKSDYDVLKSDKDALVNELESTQSAYSELNDKYNSIKYDLDKLQKEFNDTKEHNDILLDDADAYNNRITELEKLLKIANGKLSDDVDNLDKAKQNVLHADSIKSSLRKEIEIKDNTITERTNQLNQLKKDYDELHDKYDAKMCALQDKYNDEVKSNADKISKLTAGINYILNVISTKNKFVRWISGLDKAIERIEDLKNIQASAEPKAIETVKFGVPENVSNNDT